MLGCGEMGSSAVKDLYFHSEFREITVATRNMEKALKIMQNLQGKDIKITVEKIDVTNSPNLIELMKSHDIIINCVGPNYKYEVPIAKAAIEAKVNLIDINDDYETTFEMFELEKKAKEAGILIVLGLGASPGINNVFARAGADQLDDIEEIHTSWIMSGADPGGLALSYHLLYSLSMKALTYENGKLKEVNSFEDGQETIKFPEPVGSLDVYHIGHPEPITLSRVFPQARIITDKASFVPYEVNDWITSMGKMALTDKSLIKVNETEIFPMDFFAPYFHRRCKTLKGIAKPGALRTSVKGKRGNEGKTIIYSSSGLIADGTGIPASIGAQMFIQGKIKGTGVLAPESCVDWREFLKILVSRGIGKLHIEEIDS